jgi:hypothetical protein
VDFRNKKTKHLEDKFNDAEIRNKSSTRHLFRHRGIQEVPSTENQAAKGSKCDAVTDSHNIFYSPTARKLFSVHHLPHTPSRCCAQLSIGTTLPLLSLLHSTDSITIYNLHFKHSNPAHIYRNKGKYASLCAFCLSLQMLPAIINMDCK